MVSLSTPNLSALESLAATLSKRNIPYVLFYEPDINEHTAICTTDAAADLLSGYPLALKEFKKARVAQLAEQETLNLSVVGSTPITQRKLLNHLNQ